jgi:cell cycle protein kinase DBF2
MESFMSNFFPGTGKDKVPGDESSRPQTPTKKGNNSFINPMSTPQGSPSKKTNPPGAFDLPSVFDNAMSLNSTGIEAPVKLARPQSVITPLSPGKSNVQPLDEASPNVDDSVIHKGLSSGGPGKRQGQENTPPSGKLAGTDSPIQHNHAAVTRQQHYERERPLTPAKKFNTSRGLTAEEREILQKPNVRRLVNVTQLCKLTFGG